MDKQVLVLDAWSVQSLVAIRCLGQRGISVTAGANRRLTPGNFSKYVDRRFIHPSPRDRPAAFIAALSDEVRKQKYDALIVSSDATVEVVVKNRNRLVDHIGLPYAPYDTLEIALDKFRIIEAAQDAGVSHPKTISPDNLDQESIESTFSYPIVVKPRRSEGRTSVTVCDSFADLEEAYSQTRRNHGPALLQEYIPNGGEVGVYTLYDFDSSRRAVTVQERIRSAPAEGGSSTFRRTIVDDNLIANADKLLSSLQWQGVAMVEFRIDPRDGEPKLLEVNPRLWGSLALSVAAGVDFPYLLYKLGSEGWCEEVSTYRTNVFARHLRGELTHVRTRPDTLAAVWEVLQPTSGPCRFDVPSRDDPLPILGYTAGEILSLL